MKRVLTAFFALFAATAAWADDAPAKAALATATQTNADWVDYTAGHGRFHVRLPVEPTVTNNTMTEAGIAVTVSVYNARNKSLAVSAGVTEYDSDTAHIGLSVFVEAFMRGMQGEIVGRVDQPYALRDGSSLEGAILTLRRGELDCKLRVAITRVQGYSLIACIRHDSGNTAMIDEVINSFTVDP
jgi:hypothetical protein